MNTAKQLHWKQTNRLCLFDVGCRISSYKNMYTVRMLEGEFT
jgi:hypothetical protein